LSDATDTPFVRPDTRAFLDMLNNFPGPKTHELPPEAAREMTRAMRDLTDVPVGELALIRDLEIPGPGGTIPARLYDARDSRAPGPMLLYFHGGGFVIGDLHTHEPFCAEAARLLDMPVIAVDYRLAPENPWPAAPDDCEAATRWVAGNPGELGRVATGLVLAGDSAGGNLTIVTTMALRDEPAAIPVLAQFPIYPVVDQVAKYASFGQFGEGFLLTKDSMAWFTGAYAATAGHARTDPLLHSQAGMPATLVLTASLDPLRDQGRAYAGALAAAGVAVSFREALGNIHGFVNLTKAIPSTKGDIAGALAVLKDIVVEAEAQRVIAQAAG
jgi:acetyl esterase